MPFRRSFLPSTALLLVLTGCASMQNTLAQDLAEERIRTCSYIQGINIKRVEADGRVWASYQADNRSAFSAWDQCMQKAAVEQAKGRTASVAPPPSVVAAPTAGTLTESANGVPVWKPGYEWAFQHESPAGNGKYVWSVDREEPIDGVPHYVIKTGTRESFYRKADFASSRETVDGVIVVKHTPSRLNYVFPMTVGQAWDQTILEERPKDRQTDERVDTVTVEAEETISVPAGTFKTLKIVRRNKKTGAVRYEMWYAPKVTQWVKIRENLDSGVRVRELTAFRLR